MAPGAGRERRRGALADRVWGPGNCGLGIWTCGVGLIFQSYCAFYGIGQPSPRGRSFSFTVVIVTSWPPLQETRGCTGARRGVRWLVVVLLPDWAPFPSGPAFERFLPPIPGL